MSLAMETQSPIRVPDRFFIGGEWVQPSSTAMIDVIDSASEEVFFRVAEAAAADLHRAVTAARSAFDDGPWPRLSHTERAGYLRAIGAEMRNRLDVLSDRTPRESGALYSIAQAANAGTPPISITTPGWPTPFRSRSG